MKNTRSNKIMPLHDNDTDAYKKPMSSRHTIRTWLRRPISRRNKLGDCSMPSWAWLRRI
jgi:hypothetical protein